MYKKKIHIFGGGTVAHIASHLAITAPAYGQTAKTLKLLVKKRFGRSVSVETHLTKMAGGFFETNEEVAAYIDELKKRPSTKVIFFNCALVDFSPSIVKVNYTSDNESEVKEALGKYENRFNTKDIGSLQVLLTPSKKIISSIRAGRKDIFLVGFKTTCGATKQEMYEKGLRLCKEGSVNLVLVNDVKTRWNMIVTPEEAAYHETKFRNEALKELVDMAFYRSQLTFTQSTVVDGRTIPWTSDLIPSSLKTIVEYCIDKNAYKMFNGATVGHFAVKISDTEFLTSIRKTNFNELKKIGMVYVKTDGPDTVLAYGAKPSVGGQSQRIVFQEHKGYDCILHFHSPLKKDYINDIKIVSQREVECGSHQCGQNTSDNLEPFGNLKCVMLDNHGPNILFHRSIDPQEVIGFIEKNFDLSQKTGGYQI